MFSNKTIIEFSSTTYGSMGLYSEFKIIKKNDGYYKYHLMVGEYEYEREDSLEFLSNSFAEAMNIAINALAHSDNSDEPIQVKSGYDLLALNSTAKKAEYYAGGKKIKQFNSLIELQVHYTEAKPISNKHNCYRFLPSNKYISLENIKTTDDLKKQWR